MFTQTYSTTTTAVTQEQLWKLISDVDNWPQWNKHITSTRLHGQFAARSSFDFKPTSGPKVKIDLVDVQAPHAYTDLTRFPFAKMVGEHTYQDTPDGLKISITMRLSGPLAFVWNQLVLKSIMSHLPAEVEMQIAAAKKL